MRSLVWSAAFVRAVKRVVRRKPDLAPKVQRTLELLATDPFHPTLRTHRLKGALHGAWACTVDYDHRILFQFMRHRGSAEEEILLLTMGTHEEVY